MKKIKRIVGFCLLLFCCFCLISCGSEKEGPKLICTKQLMDSDGLVTYMTTVVNYEKDIIDKVTLKWLVRYDINEYSEDEIQTLVNDTVNSYKNTYGNNTNIIINSTKGESNEYYVTISVNYSKLSKSDRVAYGFDFPDGLEKSRKDFEEAGYTCK